MDAGSLYWCVCVTRFPGLATPQEQHRAWHRAPANYSLHGRWVQGPARCPPCRSAHPQGRYLPLPERGPDRVQHLLLSEGVRRPSSPAPTPPGLSSKVCLGPIIEQDTQEVKQGPAPRPRVNRASRGGLGEQAPFTSLGVSLHHKNRSLG